MWAKDPPKTSWKTIYTDWKLKAGTALRDLGPKEKKQMALRHMPLIVEKASDPCRPGQEANRVSSLSPTQVRMSDNKADSWGHLGRGASGCHLTLECTGISPTPGDTQPGSEIPEAPRELENRMEPELVRVRSIEEKKPEREPDLRKGVELGQG